MGIETRNSISREIRCQTQALSIKGVLCFNMTTSCLGTLAIMFDHRWCFELGMYSNMNY
jgi:hypothetical protein